MANYDDFIECAICKASLPIKRKSKETCSSKCYKKLKLSKRPVKQELTCIYCETKFLTHNKEAKYCSPVCSSRHYSANTYSPSLNKISILTRDNFKCIYCGKSSIEDGVKLVVDHIVPLFSGGESILTNLITACEPCNLQKGSNNLSDPIFKRILHVLNERNKSLSYRNMKNLLSEIDNMSQEDIRRIRKYALGKPKINPHNQL